MGNFKQNNKLVILLVDDEPLLRMNAVDFLEDAGFEIIEAENAAMALQILANRPDIRVLFTDVQMPGQFDGIQLARRVNELWPEMLLLITSGNKRPSRTDIPNHGHFLAKPYGEADVLCEVRSLVREASDRMQAMHA